MRHQDILRQVFGYDAYREGQQPLIEAILFGRDALGVMPTGAGKSMCFQIPALMLSGITLVISPLISLMKDQVAALKQAGVAGAFLNSSLTPGQNAEALRRARMGLYKIIYVAPERLESPDFVSFALESPVDMVAIDEAHCVSQWGQDFRPSYLKIAAFIASLPRRPCVCAFTATATAVVRADIVQMLNLQDPLCVTTGFDRPNLFFENRKPKGKMPELLAILREKTGQSGIIYCATRKKVEEITDAVCRAGYAATRYHAGLSETERRENQEAFQYDRQTVMVATNAFGMGIDKSNVSFVIHYNMPKNLESYYQEAGRAGRDGSPADCVLLYSGQDVITGRWMIEHGEENPELTPAERAAIRQKDLERLRQMTYYATSKSCLRQFILRYFGERLPEPCGHCSACMGARELAESAAVAPQAKPTPVKEKAPRTTGADAVLLALLKELRTRIARDNGMPAYLVFSDFTLGEMARLKPQTEDAFLQVNGVGERKLLLYGEAFLAVLGGQTESPSREKSAKQPREKPAEAYSPWDAGEEDALRQRFEDGLSMKEITQAHQRSRGAIKARLRKLGLID